MMRIGLLTLTLLAVPAFAGPHDFVVQHGGSGGSQQAAQPYIDQFMRYAETALKWPANSAQGTFAENAAETEKIIEEKKPAYGILDPAVYVKLQKKLNLEPIASVKFAKEAGSLHVVAKDPKIKELKDLKGKTILSNHVQDPEYINRVVFGGDLGAKLTYTPRGIKGVQAVAGGTADATILDDEQFAAVQQQMKELHEVGKPVKLLPAVVVAIGNPPDKAALAKMLMGMCSSPQGGPVCTALNGITKFTPPDTAAYADAVRRYQK